ncbi:MAG TPA: polysaccharide deacetylase family protein [Gemmatirosa sp.]|nr:polysaccharide deacetylase family protein [Gemmatirosa sp.]
MRPTVCFTIDHEPDCPPWLTATHRGVEEATAPLLAMLAELGVPATWFSTGDVAERYPDAMRAIVAGGHELGCHGHTHRRFDAIDAADADWELATASAALRRHAPVTSFRAPNLVFPDAYLPLLERHGYALDSSQARYKAAYRRARRHPAPTALARIPASVTSSVLRLPRAVRETWIDAAARASAAPLVLFVHPWEFVDLRHTRIRLDCRFHTGPEAWRRVRATLEHLAARGARFVTMRDAAAELAPRTA